MINLKKSFLGLLIAGAAFTTHAAQVLFSENFEQSALTPGANNYTPFYDSNAADVATWSDVGWSLYGSVDTVRGGYGAISGTSVDMAGTPGPGGLRRNLGFTAGVTYTLTFDYISNGPSSELYVIFGNPLGLERTNFLVTGNNASVQQFSASYFASTTGPVKLEFIDNGNYGGTVIDNILVTQPMVSAVPEPGEWALMLAGLAIVGSMARRQKSQL